MVTGCKTQHGEHSQQLRGDHAWRGAARDSRHLVRDVNVSSPRRIPFQGFREGYVNCFCHELSEAGTCYLWLFMPELS